MDGARIELDRHVGASRTRLSAWHPYPAMVADDLAVRLASAYVRPNMRILDPFCGTGRLLFAAARTAGTECIGLDVNPLACLLTNAKAAKPDILRMRELRLAVNFAKGISGTALKLRGTKVDWLSEEVARELGAIVDWLNKESLQPDELLVAAACLSAATRDAAWIRKSGWKLHRMDKSARLDHRVSAWTRFGQKLDHYLRHESRLPALGNISTKNMDAAGIGTFTADENKFDLIMTSPPYGDSRTTVQYGAASGICMDVVSRLYGLEETFKQGGSIDRACLGGTRDRPTVDFRLRDYWAGTATGEPARRAGAFLQDYMEVLRECYDALVPGGRIVTIVGRRSLGGFRLKLDDFTRDILLSLGCGVHDIFMRNLENKTTPSHINRFGRAADSEIRVAGKTRTMDSEVILALTKRESSEQLVA
jgi:site-specific DNA-methyltransferase (cytosine-N4-specific)